MLQILTAYPRTRTKDSLPKKIHHERFCPRRCIGEISCYLPIFCFRTVRRRTDGAQEQIIVIGASLRPLHRGQ
jgi:hypothetical protein